MKRIIILLIFVLQSTFGLFVINLQTVNAAGLSDPEDIFIISSPAPDSIVNGQTPISIRAYDDDQESISFFAKLFDRETCYENQIGRVTDESQLESKQNENSIVDWNTFETSSKSNIEDGEYCLQICIFLKNGDTPYSACNSREVQIANNNTRPEFTDFPTNITAKEGEEFSYQFSAQDSDGDTIEYKLKSGPESVSIDSNTGLLTGKIDEVSETTDFETTVQIVDSRGVSNEKSFKITIQDLEDNGGEGEETASVEIEIVSPTEGYIQTTKYLKVEWETQNSDSIESYKIEISENGTDWQVIAENVRTIQKYYLADVSEFSDGDYYVRVTAMIENAQDVTAVSSKFNISVKADSETEVENTIQIFEVSPGDGAVVLKTNFSSISGKFVPGENATVVPESFEIKLDGKILETCTATAEEFSCEILEIESGVHSVEANIFDSEERKSMLEWSFEIVDEFPDEQPVEESDGTVVILGQRIAESLFLFILLICCVAAVLILTPWILYYLWSRSTSKNETVVSEVEFESTPRKPLVDESINQDPYIQPVNVQDEYVYSPTYTQVPNQDEEQAPVSYVENNETNVEDNSKVEQPIENYNQPIELGKEKNRVEDVTTDESVYSNSTYSPLEDSSEIYTNAGASNAQPIESVYNDNSSNNQTIEPYTPNEFEQAQQQSTTTSSQPYLLPKQEQNLNSTNSGQNSTVPNVNSNNVNSEQTKTDNEYTEPTATS